MKRFNHDDEEFRDEDIPDIFKDDDDEEEEYEEEINAEYLKILETRELIEAMKLQVVQKELNYAILLKTIRYLEKSWFWRFKSADTKLNLIIETYQTLKALIDLDVSQYTEEEESE